MEPEVQSDAGATQDSQISLRDEMKEFLEQGESEEKSEEVAETQEEPENSESGEEESDDEESEDSEPKSEEKTEKKRPNRNQRLKARIEAISKENEKIASERDKAVEYAHLFKQRFELAQEQMKTFIDAAKQHGLEVNPLHLDNFNLKMQQREKEIIEQVAKANDDERLKLQLQRQQSEQAEDFAQEALSIASKFARGDKEQSRSIAHEILKAHAIALRADPDANMAKTAKIVMAMKAPPAEKRQAETNRSAVQPRSSQSRSGGTPKFTNTRDAMKASLEAILKEG